MSFSHYMYMYKVLNEFLRKINALSFSRYIVEYMYSYKVMHCDSHSHYFMKYSYKAFLCLLFYSLKSSFSDGGVVPGQWTGPGQGLWEINGGSITSGELQCRRTDIL